MASRSICQGVHTKVSVEKCSYLWVIKTFSQLGTKTLTSPTFSAVNGTCYWEVELNAYKKPLDSFGRDRNYFYLDGAKTKRFVSLMLAKASDNKVKFPLRQHTCIFCLKDSKDKEIKSLVWSRRNYASEKHGFQNAIASTVLRRHLADDVLKINVDVTATISVATSPVPPVPKMVCIGAALFETRKFTDFVIRVQGTDIPVHKGVLAIKSPVFEAMLLHDTIETQLGVLELKDMDLESVKAMIEFFYMYTICELNVALALNLLRAADKYNIVDLVRYCASYLRRNIDSSNVVDILLAVSSIMGVSQLKKSCLKYISKNRNKLDDKHKDNKELNDMILEYFWRVL